jgi:hypothetical protein
MTVPSENRYGARTYFGILPEFWDRIDVGYPDDVTEIYTYTTQEPNNTLIVRGVIEVTYTNATKDSVLTIVRTV